MSETWGHADSAGTWQHPTPASTIVTLVPVVIDDRRIATPECGRPRGRPAHHLRQSAARAQGRLDYAPRVCPLVARRIEVKTRQPAG
jgi:hypothetical protein